MKFRLDPADVDVGWTGSSSVRSVSDTAQGPFTRAQHAAARDRLCQALWPLREAEVANFDGDAERQCRRLAGSIGLS